MIEIQNLNKAFEQHVIFKDFNMTIQEGSFVVFCGESGCGKTTLLNMIGGLEPVDKGEILVNKKNIALNRNLRNYLQYEVGFLFQNFALIESKTVRENLNMVKKSARSEISMEEALRYVHLEDKIDTKIYKLSGGEQQRIALARLLYKKCSIILADEPTGSLDKNNAQQVIQIMQDLNKLGKTIIMVTHVEEHKQVGSVCIDLSKNKNFQNQG